MNKEKTVRFYKGIATKPIIGYNFKRDHSRREWCDVCTGLARMSSVDNSVMVQVVDIGQALDLQYDKKYLRWCNVGTFTGEIGPYKFVNGVRITKVIEGEEVW